MAVVISMLRGINVGGHRQMKMEALRAIYESLGLRDVKTYIQSGNVIFRTGGRDLALLATRIEDGIEQSFSFRPAVILRTTSDLRDVIARNPFVMRSGIDSSKLLVTFLASRPETAARDMVLKINAEPEEFRIDGREMYIYFPNGMGRPRLSAALLDRTLKTPGTGRNWNTIKKLLEIAEGLEAPLMVL